MEFQCDGSLPGRHAASRSSGSLWLKRPQAKKREPVRMGLAGHQLGWTFADPLRDPAAKVAPMVQEKLEQVQVRATELAAQRKVIA